MKSYRKELWFNMEKLAPEKPYSQYDHNEFDGKRRKRLLVKIIGE
jgi:hypothetical protein